MCVAPPGRFPVAVSTLGLGAATATLARQPGRLAIDLRSLERSDISVVEAAPLVIPAPPPRRRERRRRTRLGRWGLGVGLTLLALLAALPILSTASRLGLPFSHVGDVALIDLQARRLTEDLPLLGPYSRFGCGIPARSPATCSPPPSGSRACRPGPCS